MSTIKVNRILNSSGGEGVDGDIIGNVTAPSSITVGVTTFHSTTAFVHDMTVQGGLYGNYILDVYLFS